ncbi:MAG: hypothetical protein A2937_02355 [Candidatus Yonathbacteria bacterium RIFCSPLOWO2_01_FULL_47_33b]|uniref:GIY-YIG domain-containing protein n=1 Tax=Candidatus Yonathbacteria bacterium RIFCSPLOWO2_01_FULL_47_33b TaxID=1802727 RepID=A0A1G2SDI1_9BACT|nr:MAG: hypothetical protein A2937_02355 [Candidatus Yonathbacteria bacterium RIFCSPLOWO2_01_FULL_47_33b]
MYYTYILERDKKLYIGYTNDLARRFEQHSREYKCTLIYYEAYSSEKLAREREQKLKQYGSAWNGLKKRVLPERAG